MQLQNDFSDGSLRIGRHSVDGDMLVFDPARSPAGATNVTFFSLTQFRPRSFPRPVVEAKIEEVVDPAQKASAEALYHEWPARKTAHDQEAEEERGAVAARRRERILESHRRFVEAAIGSYPGVQESSVKVPVGSRRRARASCSVCSTALDDYVGARCMGCMAVLCSCGACACTNAPAAE